MHQQMGSVGMQGQAGAIQDSKQSEKHRCSMRDDLTRCHKAAGFMPCMPPLARASHKELEQ